MKTIAHIINPIKAHESRDLFYQQPITFQTMWTAEKFVRNTVDVQQWAVCYPEDRSLVENHFRLTKDLDRSIGDIKEFKIPRKLPLFIDILDRLYEASNAEYFIQTNADIGVQPHFYLTIGRLIEVGWDSFCINKRIIWGHYRDVKDIPLMYAELGKHHNGHDCFVFRRELYPTLRPYIGDICMGTPWSETTLMAALIAFSKTFDVIYDANITFHIGDSRMWLGHDYNDYRVHNTNEFAKMLRLLKKKNPKILQHPVMTMPQLGFLDKLKSEVTNYTKMEETYSKDCHYFVKI